jgi:hypothetical protein
MFIERKNFKFLTSLNEAHKMVLFKGGGRGDRVLKLMLILLSSFFFIFEVRMFRANALRIYNVLPNVEILPDLILLRLAMLPNGRNFGYITQKEQRRKISRVKPKYSRT